MKASVKSILLLTASSAFLVFTGGWSQSISALSGSAFVAGNIIDDSIFYNNAAMSVADIQAFLNAKVPNCDTYGTQIYSGTTTRAAYSATYGYYPPFTCLKDYSQDVSAISNTSIDLCTGSIVAGRKSSAQIIYDVAQACGISPQVLLVVLQKEQSLVTDSWPWSVQYTKATGYGCPDSPLSADVDANSNGCYDAYEGFANQVYYAAQGYKRYQKYPDNYGYRAGRSQNILYNPNTSCGSSSIYIKNQATAGLYIYTPYQPNQAALNNLYGLGDSCSSYGNRNFWRMFNDWFGPSIGPLVRTLDSGALYYSDGVSKYSVPSMQIAAEYGLGDSDVRFVSQAEIDRLQAAKPLSFIIKSTDDSDADGGNIYLVSNGKRYLITSMTQFANFGYSDTELVMMPYNQLLRMPLAGSLSNFVLDSTGFVYQINNGTKQGIFQNSVYTSLNPSGAVTPLSNYSLAHYPTGTAIIGSPLLLKSPSGQIWYARQSGWHYIGTSDIGRCMGYDISKAASYTSAQSTTGTVLAAASCVVKDTSAVIYLIDGSKKYPLTGVSPEYASSDMGDEVVTNKMTIVPSAPVVMKAGNGSLYLISAGIKRYIASMNSFYELGAPESSIVALSTNSLPSLQSGPIRYESRTVLRDSANGKLYVVDSDTLHYIDSMSLFNAYGLSTHSMVDKNDADISMYAMGAKLAPMVTSGSNAYVVDSGAAYSVPSDIRTNYGLFNLTVNSNLIPKNTRLATKYVKSSDSAKLYYLDQGQKHYIRAWSTFTSLGGSNENITTYSGWFISSIPEGSEL